MTTTVRSVRVELELGIASYVANARIAGHETDAAFSGAEAKIGRVNAGIGDLDKSTAGLSRTSAEAKVQQSGLGREIENTGRSSSRSEAAIDKYSGRLKTIAELALTLGPALIRLSAGALPAVSAGIVGIGAAAAGIGVAVLAIHGLDKAFKALNTYQLEPTAENLQKLRIEEEKLGPAGAQFVHYIDALTPQLKSIQNLARAGLFPGVEDGIDSLLTRLPLLRQIVNRVSQELGRLASDAGSALASEEWTPFFTYVRNQAAPILDAFARSAGNVALGLANILVAFDPLSQGFTFGLEDMTARFAEWSKHLEDDKGFQEFLATVKDAGPQLLDFAGSLVDLFAGVIRASAPLGEVTLPILTGIVKVLGSIANSDAGPALYSAAAGLIVLNKAASSRAITSLSGAFLDLRTSPNRAATAIQRFGGVAKAAAGAAGMGLFIASLHETNKGLSAFEGAAGGALAGFSVGGPWGAAIGGAIGLVVSLGHAHTGASQEVADFTATLDAQTGALTANSRALAVKKLIDSGALDDAKELGISLSLVTDAALGNAAAQDQLNAAVAGYDDVVTTVTTGRGASVSERFSDTAQAAHNVADAVDDVSGAVSLSQDQFGEQAAAMGAATRKTNELRGAYDQVSSAAANLETQLTTLDDFLNNRGTFRAYEASLDALRASLKDAPRDFSRMTDAGRQNLDNLDKIVSDAAAHLKTITDPTGRKQANFLDDVVAQLHNIGKTSPEAAAAVRQVLPELQAVRDANKAIVIKADNADAMKKSAETSEALHDLHRQRATPVIDANDDPFKQTFGTVKSAMAQADRLRARPTIDVDPGNSLGILGSISRLLGGLDGRVANTYVRVNRIGGTTSSAGGHSTDVPGEHKSHADGGTVSGQRHPYGDKVLIHAAPGEEVITNRHGEADHFRADRAAGRIPAYAGGGTVEDMIGRTYTTRYRGSGDAASHGSDQAAAADTRHAKAADSSAKALKRLETAADKVQKAYDKEKSKLADLISQRDSTASSIASAALHDPFGNGLAGLNAQVDADSGDLTAMTQALATLVANGLDPKSALYQQLAAHMDVNTAQQLAQLSASDLAGEATRFAAVQGQAAAFGGGVAGLAGAGGGQNFNQAIRDETKETRELHQQVRNLANRIGDLKDLPEHIKNASWVGTREGSAEGTEAGVRAANDDRRRRTSVTSRTGGGSR